MSSPDRTPARFRPGRGDGSTGPPRWLMREATAAGFRIHPSEWVVISHLADGLTRDGVATASKHQIAERSGLSRSTVKTAMTALVAEGLLLELVAPSASRPGMYAFPAEMPFPYRGSS